ncbi:hypothetical protein COLO4_13238 [Corchorus olitorius]|uniref:Uncharacterized protein n=1 Tax=Corchorus olitorius TaxID=93759 RepID=A0A1R3JXJ9_9ROSI|nr:hypothetical protein COLO4_13238 [Corchorus olitorius]
MDQSSPSAWDLSLSECDRFEGSSLLSLLIPIFSEYQCPSLVCFALLFEFGMLVVGAAVCDIIGACTN